jgi:hypothetical protein
MTRIRCSLLDRSAKHEIKAFTSAFLSSPAYVASAKKRILKGEAPHLEAAVASLRVRQTEGDRRARGTRDHLCDYLFAVVLA